MINIHSKLSELSCNSLGPNTVGYVSDNPLREQRRQQLPQQPQLQQQTIGRSSGYSNSNNSIYFRTPRRHPGGGLYKHLDSIRPVLQVLFAHSAAFYVRLIVRC
jgi:hypothetical protein